VKTLSTALLLLALGSARGAAQRVAPEDAAPSPTPAARFVALVPPLEAEGHCVTLPAPMGQRVTILQMEGANGLRRNLMLRYGADGELRAYTDARGIVRTDGTAPRTTVLLDFHGRSGAATNEQAPPGSAATRGMVLARPEEMLDLASLGTPRRMIEMVKARCGG